MIAMSEKSKQDTNNPTTNQINPYDDSKKHVYCNGQRHFNLDLR